MEIGTVRYEFCQQVSQQLKLLNDYEVTKNKHVRIDFMCSNEELHT